MPGSLTTPGRTDARAGASARVAFRHRNGVGTRNNQTFAAQWLACTSPCRCFAAALASCAARLGADVDRYSFVVSDFHRLLLAGLPAHYGFRLIDSRLRGRRGGLARRIPL
jgi:hypothetical protein